MNKVFTSSALAIAASMSLNAFAQSNEEPVTQLEPIIVSAGISPVAADQYGRSYTVITRKQIEERGYATVQQALEAQPGISMNGSAPSDRQIRIRGGEGSHTLVLIDGVRAASGDNEYVLRGLDTSYIERIEVLRGPQSVPFGTDASTGVINIVTREAGRGLNIGGSVEYGEGDSESAYISHGNSLSQISLTVSNLNDRGFDYSGEDGERDSTRWKSLVSKGDVSISNQLNAGFTLRLADGRYDLDENADGFSGRPSSDNEQEYVFDDPNKNSRELERAGSGYLEYRTSEEIVGHRLAFNRTSNQSETVTDSITEIFSYRAQYAADRNVIDKSRQLWSLLAERKTDESTSDVPDRITDSLAIEYAGWVAENISAQAGIRRDINDAFSDSTSWNVASNYFFGNGVRLHGSIGRAIVNPSFFEFTGGTSSAFNGDLEPEENEGFDVGLEIPIPRFGGSVGLTYFNETLTNEISSNDFGDPPYKYENDEGESDRQGVELTANFSLNPTLKVRGSYTYLDATDPDGEIEIRRPRNEATLVVTWMAKQLPITINGDLRHVRGLYDQQFWESFPYPTERLPNFTTFNLSSEYQITRQVALTARVTNLTDEDAKEVWGYATRGRAGYVGVRASW